MRKKLTILVAVAGLVLLLGSSALADDLVVNGGFETGNFSGWTVNSDTTWVDGVVNGGTPIGPHSGNDRAVLGPWQAVGTLSQDVNTVAGATYDFSFWLANDVAADPADPNSFAVSWNGNTLMTMTNANAFGWTLYAFKVVGAAPTSTIQFTFYNYAGYFYLDDVDPPAPVGAVPEPASLLLMGSGLLGLSGLVRRRLQK